MKQPFLWVPKPHTPLYMQLYHCIKESILEGAYEKDQKMPSIRLMASSLALSKTTVEMAYQQLLMEGYLLGVEKVGYFVEDIRQGRFVGQREASIVEADLFFKSYINTDVDKEGFDLKLWKRYINKSLLEYGERLYGYGHPQGALELREALSDYVRDARGVLAHPGQIVIGAGTQQLLFILAEMLKGEYSQVFFEKPVFIKAKHIFEALGYQTREISLDEDFLKQNNEKALLYVSPSHQFPFAQTMSISKRLGILNWAKRNEAFIIEDDYDGELRYQGQPIPSMQGLNKGKNVIYLGALSKILMPTIRLSFMVLPSTQMENYQPIAAKYAQTASGIEQLTLSKFIQDGALERHVRKIRKIYAKKSKMITYELQRQLSKRIETLSCETGFYIIFEFFKEAKADLVSFMEAESIKIIKYSYEKNKRQKTVYLMPFSGLDEAGIAHAVACIKRFAEEKMPLS